MIRIKDIQDGLAGLVGFEQGEGELTLAEDLTVSESGLTYQQVHPLLTLQNVKGMLEEGVDLSDFLRGAVRGGIATMTNRVLADGTLKGMTKQLFERKPLFDGAGRINNRIATHGSVVGYEIVPLRGLGVTTQIHRIGLQMYGGTGTVKVYLFHSSQREPLATAELNYTGSKSYEWFAVEDWFLRYMGEAGSTNAGGAWYVVYDQTELPEGMEAVNVSKDWSREPCQSCNMGNVEAWRAMTRNIRVSPFRVKADGFSESPELWDLQSMVYTNTTCYGMNLDLSIGCDLSDFIIGQRGLFASVLQKQVGVDLLRRMAFNPDVTVNRNQLNASRQDLILEIDGNSYTRSGGLGGLLKKAYDALEVDISGMDSACMACKRQGVRYGMA